MGVWTWKSHVPLNDQVERIVGLRKVALCKEDSLDAARVPNPNCKPVGTTDCWLAEAPGWTMF